MNQFGKSALIGPVGRLEGEKEESASAMSLASWQPLESDVDKHWERTVHLWIPQARLVLHAQLTTIQGHR